MLFKVFGDCRECLAFHIESKNKPHNLSFGGNYLRQAVLAFFVTEELCVGQGDLTVCHTLAFNFFHPRHFDEHTFFFQYLQQNLVHIPFYNAIDIGRSADKSFDEVSDD